MLNVACLYPVWFERILSGRKTTEWRRRKRIDGRLEKIRPGEHVVFLECGSSRAIRCRIRGVRRHRDLDGKMLYEIRISECELVESSGVRHLQGWHRRATL